MDDVPDFPSPEFLKNKYVIKSKAPRIIPEAIKGSSPVGKQKSGLLRKTTSKEINFDEAAAENIDESFDEGVNENNPDIMEELD